MSAIYILCLEDEPEVLDNVVRDLGEFEDTFPIEAAGSVQEARKIVADLTVRGDRVGVILCDHIMPGEDGVSFLVELADREETVLVDRLGNQLSRVAGGLTDRWSGNALRPGAAGASRSSPRRPRARGSPRRARARSGAG